MLQPAVVAAQYRAGASIRRLAARYHRKPATIRALLIANDVTIRRPAPATGTRFEAAGMVDVDAVIAAYRNGVSLERLAYHHHVTDTTIRRRLQTAGIPLRPPAARGRPVNDETLVAAYQAGRSIRDLAREYGADRATIRAHLVNSGVTIRPPGGSHRLLDADIAGEYQAGRNLTALAAIHHVDHSTVRRIVTEAGITIRPDGPRPRWRIPIDHTELVARYRAGATYRELADIFHVDRATIRRRLNVFDEPHHPNHP